MSDRRAHPRPYFFEILAVANLLLISALASRHGLAIIRSIPSTVLFVGGPLLGQLAGGVIVRSIAAATRGQMRAYLRRLTTAGWLSDTARVLVFGIVLVDVYGWIKLTIQVIHPHLMDRQLWDLDRALFFGLQPNIFFLSLFSPHAVLRTFDWTYGNIFLASMFVAFGFFLSSPSRRLRIGFLASIGLLWMAGAWLYVLVPSLGPAYYFPDIWFGYSDSLSITQRLQSALMRNYQNFIRIRAGSSDASVNLLWGIAAFPSLHVAFQLLVFFWFRRLWLSGQVIFAIFLLMIFLGSVITGWHYLVDSYAGLLLGFATYWPVARAYRIDEWARLRRALSR